MYSRVVEGWEPPQGYCLGVMAGRGPATLASVAINKSLALMNVVVLEGEIANTTIVSTNVLIVSGDFKLW